MKKLIKLITRVLIKFLTSSVKLKHYILEILEQDPIEMEVKHQDINLRFMSLNNLTKYRIDTFSSKEPKTLEWIDNFHEKSIFWDIGANIGLYSCYASKKIKNCKTFSFEPSVFNLEILAKNINLNNLNDKITIIPISISDKDHENNFKLTTTKKGGAISTFGSTITFDGSNIDSVFEYKTIGMSLDSVLNQFSLSQPNYIKIDVDGIEHLILEGADRYLGDDKLKSLSIEINENFTEQHDKALKIMKEYNFKILHKKQNREMHKSSKHNNTFNYIFVR